MRAESRRVPQRTPVEADVYSCLSLVSHEIKVGRVHFTDGATEAREHLVQDPVIPWVLKPLLFLMFLIQTSVVSQHLLSLSVSLLLGSVIFLFFSFSRKKSQNRTVPQPGNLMAFPLMPQPIPLSFLNSRVSCILMSSLQENEHLNDPSIIRRLVCVSFQCPRFCWYLAGHLTEVFAFQLHNNLARQTTVSSLSS